MVVIKKVGVFSAGKVSSVLGGIIALLIGIFLMILETIFHFASDSILEGLIISVITTAFLIILFMLCGFIYGVIFTLLYNLIARIVGGLRVDFGK